MALGPADVGRSDSVCRSWTERDCMLYALAVGCGTEDLRYTTENTKGVALQVLPTMAIVIGAPAPVLDAIGSLDRRDVVHAGQEVELVHPLPTSGTVETTSTIASVLDKGSGALVVTESTSCDAVSGALLFRSTSFGFIKGAGGFGGARRSGTAAPIDPVVTTGPARCRQVVVHPAQALLYRLTGDRNPLHSDPSFARDAGFDRPILHGLCTLGITVRVATSLLRDDAGSVRGVDCRFTAPVYPGDRLDVEVRPTSAGGAFTVLAGDRRVLVGSLRMA